MKAVVTGAGGFCGRHLTSYLQSEGADVIPLSLRGDSINDENGLRSFLVRAEPDFIFHLAGLAAGIRAKDYFTANVLFADTLIRATQNAGLADRPLLLVGTSAEYGMVAPSDVPIREDMVCQPYNLYGISKLAQTLIGLAALAKDSRPIVIVRPFNIIGDGMPQHLALASFHQQLLKIKSGERPPVLKVGNLSAARDFIDVDDVVRIYWKLVQNERGFGKVFNVCTGVPTKIGALLELLINEFRLAVTIEHALSLDKPIDVPLHFGSNERLHDVIGPFNYTPIAETIRKLVS